jgi:defect-in-organelle-trafficking protein DotC
MNKLTLILLFFASATAAGQSYQPASSSTHVPGDAYWNMSSGPEPTASSPVLTRDQVLSAGIIKEQGQPTTSVPWVRAQAIQAAAAAYGSQAGNRYRASEIQKMLAARSSQYDRTFDFSAVMLEQGFLPPVITEGRDAYNQPNSFEARAADRIFKIELPARIVAAPPRWQEYLLAFPAAGAALDRSVLPSSTEEKRLWDEWASRGWEQGVALADMNFESNLGRLRRDFEGMLRFKMLYQQGLVSRPMLARTILGVTGGGNEMAIGDRIIRVSATASLNPKSKEWASPMPITHIYDIQFGGR